MTTPGWLYKLVGATTVHLQHEFLLWVSMTLLIISSFSSSSQYYRVGDGSSNNYFFLSSLITTGDIQFLLLTSLWLGRNVWIKWLITSDVSTHRSPSFGGIITHWLSSHFFAGQYFDRPKDLQSVAKQVGTHHSDEYALRTHAATISSFFLPSILFTWQWISLRLIGPIWKLQSSLLFCFRKRGRRGVGVGVGRGGGRAVSSSSSSSSKTTTSKKQKRRNSASTTGSSSRNSSSTANYTTSFNASGGGSSNRNSNKGGGSGKGGGRGGGGGDRMSSSSSSSSPGNVPQSNYGMSLTINQAYLTWNKVWSMYGPPLQMLIPLLTLGFFMWYIIVPPHQEEQMHALTMTTRNSGGNGENNLDDRETKPFGAYHKLTKPKWSQLFVCMSAGGTLATICMYTRVILPMADLVAGTNVLKAVRNESKLYAATSTSSSGKSRSKVQRENTDVPWAEQQKPITTENRFRLICKIAGIKLVENLFVCALLPRTGIACRATGHCPESASLTELSKIFYPAGITSPLRSDAIQQSTLFSYFLSNSPDKVASIMTIISTIIITWTLLISQAATLNRSYLGIMGHIAGEWVVVKKSSTTDPNNAAAAVAGNNATNWDPRRRYKKGDLISQTYPTGGQSIYRATSNSPEGRPYDLYLRATHDLFRNELGHPAESQIIAFVSGIQFVLVYVLIVLIFVYQLFDYHYTSLLWTLGANLVAAIGVSCSVLPNYKEYNSLAEQINKK